MELLDQSKDGKLKVYHCPEKAIQYILLVDGESHAGCTDSPDFLLDRVQAYNKNMAGTLSGGILLATSKDYKLAVWQFPQLIAPYILFREGRQSASSNHPDYPLQLLAEYERWVEHQASWNKWMTWQKLND